MTTIKTFVFNPFQENTYVIYDHTKECIIVDAGCFSAEEQNEIISFIKNQGLTVKLIVTTHGHIDHVLGNAFLKNQFNVDIAGNPEDLPLIQMAPTQALMYGLTIEDVPTIDKNLNDGETLTFGETQFSIIHTPGHSKGGICLYNQQENYVITGDTLFKASIGRTDLPGGSYEQLISSISQKLLALPENTKVYPGHGEPTTIGWEHENNPFLK